MEFDRTVQSEALAARNLRAIKDFSPFNEYLIGEKSALFKSSTGTQIYIWNLDKWGSDYSLEWQADMSGSSSFHGDILIRSRRVRSRPGQTSRKVGNPSVILLLNYCSPLLPPFVGNIFIVCLAESELFRSLFQVPLDYSLRSYLEVIFLEPRMKIYVQGSPVIL